MTMNTRLLFPALALGLLGLATVPNAVAGDLPVDTSIGLLQCWTTSFDAQADGHAEPWTVCSTPTCGCNCPYVGAGVVVEAAPIDRQVGAEAVTSGCQTAYATTNGPADGNDGRTGLPVTPIVLVGGGAIDPIESA
jgi:hypothetical protein